MANLTLRNGTDKYAFGPNDNGGVSLFHPAGYQIPDDEPVLIFRAKDLGVLAAITAYIDMLCEQEPSKTIKDHLLSMLAVSANILKYQKNKAVKSVTCSMEAHRGCVESLNKDVRASLDFALDVLRSTYGVDDAELAGLIGEAPQGD